MAQAWDDRDAGIDRAAEVDTEPDVHTEHDRNDVADHLASIEERPLSERAESYIELHESLSAALESEDHRHPE